VDSDPLGLVKCQQCLGDLRYGDGAFACDKCSLRYPVRQNLIFMGYDRKEQEHINKIILTESAHQTNLDEIDKHYDFAQPSFKLSLILANMAKNDIESDGAVALDVGCAGGPTGKILSESGFNTYRCELDPNSLFSGLHWKHKNLQFGKHIVCDTQWLPFPNESADLVFCKELVHHIADFAPFFREVNRVLKNNGVFILAEPSINYRDRLAQILGLSQDKHYGHHYQVNSAYLKSLKESSFQLYRYFIYDYQLKRPLFLNADEGPKKNRLPHSSLKMKFQRAFGGSNVFFLRKTANLRQYPKRPQIELINSKCLLLTDDYLEDERLKKFHQILHQAAQGK